MKGRPTSIRLDPETEKEIAELARITGLSENEIIRQAISAGVKAIVKNGNKLTLPLELSVTAEQKSQYPDIKSERLLIEEPKPEYRAKSKKNAA